MCVRYIPHAWCLPAGWFIEKSCKSGQNLFIGHILGVNRILRVYDKPIYRDRLKCEIFSCPCLASRKKFHQTTYQDFSRSLYNLSRVKWNKTASKPEFRNWTCVLSNGWCVRVPSPLSFRHWETKKPRALVGTSGNFLVYLSHNYIGQIQPQHCHVIYMEEGVSRRDPIDS